MRIVSGEVIPEIEARHIQGFRHIDLLRRDTGGEVEFTTLMCGSTTWIAFARSWAMTIP